MDNDILLFRFGLHNRSQIGYTIDFIRFYIQDAKKRKKTAVQQLEQQPLFSFNRPEEVAALSSCDFTVALPKFTIPDKKVLIIEIQERNGPIFDQVCEEYMPNTKRHYILITALDEMPAMLANECKENGYIPFCLGDLNDYEQQDSESDLFNEFWLRYW